MSTWLSANIFNAKQTFAGGVYLSGGRLGVGIDSASAGAAAHVKTPDAATIGAIVQGYAAQTANLHEWQDSAGAVVASVSPAGSVTTAGQFAPTNITTSSPTGATQAINLATGNVQILNLANAAAGNVTVTLSGMLAGGSYAIKVIQHATVPVNVIFTGVLWGGGTAPTISTGAGDVDIISLIYDGTTMYGSYVQDFG